MKVLHVATYDSFGAGKGLLNLHRALLAQGIDSKVLVANKTVADNTIFQMNPNYQLFNWSKNRLVVKVQKILRRRGKCQTVVEKWDNKINKVVKEMGNDAYKVTSPFSNYNVRKHPLVKEADVIHLHWIDNFIDYPSFFDGFDKPIVWTLRDENPGLGGFHYRTDKMKYGSVYNDIESAFLNAKKTVLAGKNNITLIALSDEMIRFCKEVDFLSEKKVQKIYNPIDSGIFRLVDKKTARTALGLDEDALVLSFASMSLLDQRKGFCELLVAIQRLKAPVVLLCMGRNDLSTQFPKNVICFGNVEDGGLQSIIYSASDIFISPSRQESFGKTVAEALLCGVPVISTKVGFAPEVINESCGCLIENTSPDAIVSAIDELCKKPFDRKLIREMATNLFDPIRIAKDHIEVYSEAIMNS